MARRDRTGRTRSGWLRIGAAGRIPAALAAIAVAGAAVTLVAVGAGTAQAVIPPPPEVVSLGPSGVAAGSPNPFWGGRVEALALSPANRTLVLAASSAGGLWRSTTLGSSWSRVNTLPVTQLFDVVFGDRDANLVVATAYTDTRNQQAGVWISTDAGAHWSRPAGQDGHCGDPAAYKAHILQVGNPAVELIEVGTACGVLSSRDSGTTWTFVDPGGRGGRYYDVQQRTVPEGLLVDACGENGFYRSINGGTTWSADDPGTPHRGNNFCTIATAPDDPNTVITSSFGGAKCSARVQESDDAGLEVPGSAKKPTWTDLNPCGDGNGQRPWVLSHESFDATGKVAGTFEVYVGTSSQIVHQTCSYHTFPRCKVGTADDKGNWPTYDGNMNHHGSDPTDLLWSPLAPGCPQLESGDGGVFAILDCTATPAFRESSTGLDAIEAYAVAGTAFADHTNLYLATQDNGLFVSQDTGSTWTDTVAADIFTVHSDPTGPGSAVLYSSCCPGGLNQVNVDGTGSKTFTALPPGGIGAYTQFGTGDYAAITSDKSTPPKWSLQVSTDSGAHWTQVGPQLPAGPCFPIGCDRWVNDLQIAMPPGGTPTFFLHLGVGPSKLYRVSGPLNATASLVDLGAPPAAGEPRALQDVFSYGVDPTDPTRVYALDNVGTGKMMRGTAPTAAGTFTWTEDTTLERLVSLGGQSTPLKQVKSYGFDGASRTVVIGTSRAGVLLSLDGGLNWYTARGSGAIPDVVNVYVNPGTHKVYAASFGRGLWEIRPVSRLSFLLGRLPLFTGALRTVIGADRISLAGDAIGGANVTAVSYRFYRQNATPPSFTTVKASTATFSLSGSNGVYVVDAFASDNAGNEKMHQSELVDLENPTTVCSASTTLHGTFILDADRCAQSPNTTGDLFWEQIDTVQRQLVPFFAGDQVAVLGKTDFSKVTIDQIRAASLGTTPVNGSNNSQNQLTPGTVLAVHTRSGNYAKIRVDSYGYDLGLTITTYKQSSRTGLPSPTVLCTNAGTIQGTFIYDAQSCQQSGTLTGDLFWEQIDDVQRQLVPESPGDQIAILGKVDFGTVGLPDLLTAPYSTAPVNGSNNTQNQLTPGTVLAIHTRDGHYAKMRIDSYGYNLGVATVTYQ